MESLAVALAIILVLVVIEIISKSASTLEDEPLTPTKIDHEQNKLAMFKWQKAEYLSSKEWKIKRAQVKERDNHSCQVCSSKDDLHVHHMSGYNLIPNEPLTCLITLCSSCHKSEHEKVGYPQNYSEYMTFNFPIKKDQ